MFELKRPIHPGEVLREEFLQELALSAGRVAKAINVPRTRIERLVREEKGMSVDTAMRLSKLFGTSPDFWLNLQIRYEIAKARQDETIMENLSQIEAVLVA